MKTILASLSSLSCSSSVIPLGSFGVLSPASTGNTTTRSTAVIDAMSREIMSFSHVFLEKRLDPVERRRDVGVLHAFAVEAAAPSLDRDVLVRPAHALQSL